MGILNEIRAIYRAINPPIPGLSEAAKGLCVLPPPVRLAKVKEALPPPDIYVINEVTKSFGFHSATARNQFEGSVPEITNYDKQALIDRGQWPKKKQAQDVRSRMKRLWHDGATVSEIRAATSQSESLVEKIIAAFPAALEMEKQENSAPLPKTGGEGA